MNDPIASDGGYCMLGIDNANNFVATNLRHFMQTPDELKWR